MSTMLQCKIHKPSISKMKKISLTGKRKKKPVPFHIFQKKSEYGNSKTSNKKYYICQQHGREEPHRKIGEESRKTDRRLTHGRIKTGAVCISSIKTNYLEDGSINAMYNPTHSHPIDPSNLQFHPLSSDSYRYIDSHLAAGASPLAIRRELRNKAVEKAEILQLEQNENFKDCYVSLKLIRERARKKQSDKMHHADDAKSLMILTEELQRKDPDIVVIYKPLGMVCEIGPVEINNIPDSENIFMYGLQTQEQRNLMMTGCKSILVVDETHCTNQYGYSLLNMLVVDENKHGWPVGHCITNKTDEKTLQFFFKAIKNKIPHLEINSVITDDDQKLINAMELGFGEELRHILCIWHLSRTFKKQLREKAQKAIIDDMFVALKLIVDAKSLSEFEKYSVGFVEKYKESAPDFIKYFKQNYLTDNRISKWARCYRNFAHDNVDTTGHVESFHKRLKSVYMNRKPNKRLDNLVQLLVTIAEDDLWTRKRLNNYGVQQTVSSIVVRHKKGISILDEAVKSIFDNMWEVTSSSESGKVHVVAKCRKQCSSDLCFCKCKECPDLCSHLYHCSCKDSEPLCKHVHKLHSLISRSVISHLNSNKNESKQPFFSEALLESSTHGRKQEDRRRYREFRLNQLEENLKEMLLFVEKGRQSINSLPDNILNRMNAVVDDGWKCCKVLVEGIVETPTMEATVSFTSNEKLKTQVSQMLPFKRPKKRSKPFNTAAAASKKKAVAEDLASYLNDSVMEDGSVTEPDLPKISN